MINPYAKIRICKKFASDEYSVRNNAYKIVKKLLKLKYGTGKGYISEVEIIGIWKGMFVWLAMQDKALLHDEVLRKITGLLENDIIDEKVAIEFIKGFMITMKREWSRIRVVFVDKFYALVRDMIAATVKWMDSHEMNGWDEVEKILEEDLLGGSVFDLKMHIIDVLLQESARLGITNENLTSKMVLVMARSCVDAAKGRRDVYANKVRSRLAGDLIKRCKEGKLKVNLLSLSNTVREWAQNNEMNAAARKFFYYLSGMYAKAALVEVVEATKEEDDKEVMDVSGEVEEDNLDLPEEEDEDVDEEMESEEEAVVAVKPITHSKNQSQKKNNGKGMKNKFSKKNGIAKNNSQKKKSRK